MLYWGKKDPASKETVSDHYDLFLNESNHLPFIFTWKVFYYLSIQEVISISLSNQVLQLP